jgi:hypothetical protein
MRKQAPGRQFLPPDNPKWAKFFEGQERVGQ